MSSIDFDFFFVKTRHSCRERVCVDDDEASREQQEQAKEDRADDDQQYTINTRHVH